MKPNASKTARERAAAAVKELLMEGGAPDAAELVRVVAEVFTDQAKAEARATVTAPSDAFYMVWTRDGRNPTFQHNAIEKALAEAERLAACHPNKVFYVLQSVSRVASPRRMDVERLAERAAWQVRTGEASIGGAIAEAWNEIGGLTDQERGLVAKTVETMNADSGAARRAWAEYLGSAP